MKISSSNLWFSSNIGYGTFYCKFVDLKCLRERWTREGHVLESEVWVRFLLHQRSRLLLPGETRILTGELMGMPASRGHKSVPTGSSRGPPA